MLMEKSMTVNEEFELQLTKLGDSESIDHADECLRIISNLFGNQISSSTTGLAVDKINAKFVFSGANAPAFRKNQHDDFILLSELIFEHIVPRFFARKPSAASKKTLDGLFLKVSPASVIMATVSWLTQGPESSRKFAERELIKCLLEKRANQMTGLCQLAATWCFDSSFVLDPLTTNMAVIAGQLASIPDRCSQSAPSSLKSPHFFHIALKELHKGVQASMLGESGLSHGHRGASALFGTFIGRLCRRGHADVCATVLLPMVQSSADHPDAATWHSVLGCVLEERSEQRFLEALLLEMSKRKMAKTAGIGVLETFVGDTFWDSSSIRHLLTEKFILSGALPLNCLPWILHFADKEPCQLTAGSVSSVKTSLKMTVLDRLARTWSPLDFVRNEPQTKQESVTQALILLLKTTSKEDLSHASGVIPGLLGGVTARLDSPLAAVRRMGQRLAVAFSLALDPEKPIHFGEFEDEDQWGRDTSTNMAAPGPETLVEAAAAREDPSLEDPESDSDSLVPIGEEYGADSASDSDSGDGDLPVQLRGLLEAIRDSTDKAADKCERAIRHAERMIRADADELEHVSADLARALLHAPCSTLAVEGTEADLETCRHSALVALLVKSPGPCLAVLSGDLFSPHLDQFQRILIISVMKDAARELASGSPTASVSSVSGSAPKVAILSERVAAGPWMEFDALLQYNGTETGLSWAKKYERTVPMDPGSKLAGTSTVKKGARVKKSSEGNVSRQNGFAKWAPVFLLPLLREFDVVRQGVDWIHRDFLVLEAFLSLLGTCLDCSQGQIALKPVWGPVFELLQAKSIAFHAEPSIRRSALLTAISLMRSLPPAMIVSDLLDGGSALLAGLTFIKEWASIIADSDPDDDCCLVAISCLQTHQKIAEEAFEVLKASKGESMANVSIPSKNTNEKLIVLL